jgi:hypothetical protein
VHMPDEESLCSLVARRSVRRDVDEVKIWRWICDAIREDRWIEPLQGAQQLAYLMDYAIRTGRSPARQRPCENITADPDAFDRWLKAEIRKCQFPAIPKRRCKKSPKRDAILAYVERYGDRALPTYKEIAKATGSSESTVKHVLAGK